MEEHLLVVRARLDEDDVHVVVAVSHETDVVEHPIVKHAAHHLVVHAAHAGVGEVLADLPAHHLRGVEVERVHGNYRVDHHDEGGAA